MRPYLLLVVVALLAGCLDGGDGDSGGSASVSGPDPFSEAALTTFEITLDAADWSAMVADPLDNTWRHASVRWQGETYVDVAVRPSGETTRIPGNPKPSMRLSFDEFVPGRSFHGYSGIKLDSLIKDPSMMRERLAYDIYRSRGVAAPRYAHARVVVNGEYKGLFGVEERANRTFVRQRFGEPVNQLLKWTAQYGDMVWLGSDPLVYVPDMFDDTIETLPMEGDGVRDLIDAVQNRPAEIARLFDVDAFLNFMAVEVATGETDGYIGGPWPPDSPDVWTSNFYLYRNPKTGQYTFIVWDRDFSYWRTEQEPTFGFSLREMTRRVILENPEHLQRYRQMLRETIQGPHAIQRMHGRIQSIYEQIKDAALEDTLKPWSNVDFELQIDWLKAYVETRNAELLRQLP